MSLKRTITMEKVVANKKYKRDLPRKKTFKSSKLFQPISSYPELKSYSVTNSVGPSNVTGQVLLLNGITQGSLSDDMIGAKALLKSISFKYFVKRNVSTVATFNTTQPEIVRVLLVYDSEPNGVLPAFGDILTSISVTALPNSSNTDRFTILSDNVHELGIYALITGNITYSIVSGPLNACNAVYRKMNLTFEGPSTLGAIAGIRKGAIYCLTCSDSTAATTNLSYNSRIRYSDN